MIDRPDRAWWRWMKSLGTGLAPLALLPFLALSSARVVTAFEVDALIITLLIGLLFWTQLEQCRHARRVNEKLDLLAIRLRYGPLTDEDLDTIRILKSGAQASRQVRANSHRSRRLAFLFPRLRRRASTADRTPPDR